jgi:hypothetical protein
MRKFQVETESGNTYVAQLKDQSAKEIARGGCKVYAIKEDTHENPVMD